MSRPKPASRWSPTAPTPDNAAECRWCHGRRQEIAPAERCILHLAHEGPHLFTHTTVEALPNECQAGKPALIWCGSGCAGNDEAPYLRQCPECGKDFETGRTLATLCHACEQVDIQAHHETPFEGNTYNYSQFKRGGYR